MSVHDETPAETIRRAIEQMPEKCRFMAAAYPDLDAVDACREHRHDEATFALARALAEVCQQPDPTDEQVGWLLDDAGAVVDDFDPAPGTWTVTEPQLSDEVGVEFAMTINGVDYVIEPSEWEPSRPIRRSTWQKQIDEVEGDSDDRPAPRCPPPGPYLPGRDPVSEKTETVRVRFTFAAEAVVEVAVIAAEFDFPEAVEDYALDEAARLVEERLSTFAVADGTGVAVHASIDGIGGEVVSP